MTETFDSPYLRRKVRGKFITFNVTKSAPSTNTPLNQINAIMDYLRKNRAESVLDFGAGRLRNAWPLLEGGFKVYVTEFEELIPPDDPNLAKARDLGLKTLIYPRELLAADVSFDAILLSYVIHILPDQECRDEVLGACWRKLKNNGTLVVASPNFNTNVREGCTKYNEHDIGWFKRAPGTKPMWTFYSEPDKADLVHLISPMGFQYEDHWPQRTAKVLRFRKVP